MSRATVIYLFVLLGLFQSPGLDARVRSEISGFKGQINLYAKNLDTGASYGLGADERVRTASTIKVPTWPGLRARRGGPSNGDRLS